MEKLQPRYIDCQLTADNGKTFFVKLYLLTTEMLKSTAGDHKLEYMLFVFNSPKHSNWLYCSS